MASNTKFESSHADLVRSVKATCIRYGIPEPDEFLTEVMAGRDPRLPTGELYDLVQAIAKEDRLPTDIEWDYLKSLVLTNDVYKTDRVKLNTSIAAATKLVDHLYPKLKALEITGEVSAAGPVTPLTEEEIAKFNRDLENDDF